MTGRPKKEEGELRVSTTVWMRKNAYQKLVENAKSVGLSYSNFCESLLLKRNPKFQTKNQTLLIKEVNRIGVNVNQITKKVNTQQNGDTDLREQLETIQEELEAIKEMIERSK